MPKRATPKLELVAKRYKVKLPLHIDIIIQSDDPTFTKKIPDRTNFLVRKYGANVLTITVKPAKECRAIARKKVKDTNKVAILLAGEAEQVTSVQRLCGLQIKVAGYKPGNMGDLVTAVGWAVETLLRS